MTETAREALMRRAKEADKTSDVPKKSARELLADRASGKTFELPKDTSKPAPPAGYNSPYSYYTPEVQRNVGNTGNDAGSVVEPLAQMATGAVAAPVAGLSGIAQGAWNELAPDSMQGPSAADRVNQVQGALTYEPKSEGGQDVSGALASGYNPLTWPGRAGEFLGDKSAELGMSPKASTILRTLPDALSMLVGGQALKARGAKIEAPVATPQELLNKAASSQTMGAAGAAVDLKTLSPALRADVEKAVQQTGGAVNPDALARSVQADALPVPVRLTPGQKLGDPRLISEERNGRGATTGVVEGFEAQGKALTENLRAFREKAGEDVFSTNPVEHADTLISRYKAIDEARNADIGAKYQALRDAAGGDFPIDTPGLLNNVRAALKKDHATNGANPDIMSSLEESASTGKIALEDFERLRSSLARIQREGEGSQRHAAGVIRRQLEDMPLAPGAEQLKGLADTARAAARERFQALDADPAYKAAVEDSTPPDKFVHKFVVNGTRDNVARLSEAMAPDTTAAQTLKVATLDHIRQMAGIDPAYNGKFTQSGYNKALRALEPKLGSLVDPELAEQMRNLGDVARYSQFQPEGSFVNNSNTFVAAAASKSADVLEGAANLKAGGIPVGTWVRKNVTDRQGRKAAEKMFAPGSGLTKLNELMSKGKETR